MSGSTTPPVATIDATGIHAPSYSDILSWIQGQYRAIYGSDVYLGNDSQDGQWIGVIAALVNDTNSLAVSAYNSYSPATAQGAGLSSVVKINGLVRGAATVSQVSLVLTGTPGALITNGIARDQGGNQWVLPSQVALDPTGQATVTALAASPGVVTAPAGAVNIIATPTLGWNGVTNPTAALPGVAAESDVMLRARQALSTAIPATTPTGSLIGALAALPGTGRLDVYENTGSITDANGVPGHTVSVVIEGGNPQQIANVIGMKKTIGCGTYGTTTQTYIDNYGLSRAINFYRPSEVAIAANVSVHALTGYTTIIGNEISAAVAAYVNSLAIGQSVFLGRLFVPANLQGAFASPGAPNDTNTYDLLSIQVGRKGTTLQVADTTLQFYEAATCSAADVAITVQ